MAERRLGRFDLIKLKNEAIAKEFNIRVSNRFAVLDEENLGVYYCWKRGGDVLFQEGREIYWE